MSHTKLLYHIIIRTKHSAPTLFLDNSDALYNYIWGIVKNKESVLYRINGMEDHLHLFVELHPTIALSDFIKDIKQSSSYWIKKSGLFPQFEGWGREYAAFTYSERDKNTIINYIKNQREHHKRIDVLDEVKALLDEFNIVIDEKYL